VNSPAPEFDSPSVDARDHSRDDPKATASLAAEDPGSCSEASAQAFDAMADRYDEIFTDTALGRLLRARVWRELAPLVAPGRRAVDLGCGTGVDALHLARLGLQVRGIDASGPMIVRAEARRMSREGSDRDSRESLSFRQGRIEDPATLGEGPYRLALSNFGVLNCVEDLPAVGREIALRLEPGGFLVAVLMGPVCLWELAMLPYAPRRALRRLRGGPVAADLGSGSFRVHYPGPARLAGALAPAFTMRRLRALGILLPPTDAAAWLRSRPALLAGLDRVEARLAGLPMAARLSDHYIAVFQKRDEGSPER
jgi:SAM-dependent methyltransferase